MNLQACNQDRAKQDRTTKGFWNHPCQRHSGTFYWRRIWTIHKLGSGHYCHQSEPAFWDQMDTPFLVRTILDFGCRMAWTPSIRLNRFRDVWHDWTGSRQLSVTSKVFHETGCGWNMGRLWGRGRKSVIFWRYGGQLKIEWDCIYEVDTKVNDWCDP